MRHLITALLLTVVTFHLSLAIKDCVEYLTDDQTYRYTICTGTQAKAFNTSRMFCQKLEDGYDLVTFPNKEQFDFLHEKIRETVGNNTFRYFVGVYQEADFSDRYDPQTGNFFWINDPKNKITTESSTYWKPFEYVLVDLHLRDIIWRQIGNFVLNATGYLYPGQTIGGGQSRIPVYGDVACQKRKRGIIRSTSGRQAPADVIIALNLIIALVRLL